jgi:PASTA domain-containing protein/List-Bact-rpt repeat protein
VHVPGIRPAARATLASALVLCGLVAQPTAARAAITGSQITTPSDPSFFVADEDAATQFFAIAGTTSGGNPATDEIAIRCYFGTKSVKLAGPVPLNPDGSFAVLLANLNNVLDLTCRLRAVPSGAAPADLTPFAGPLIGVGERATSRVKGGPNNTKAYDYVFDAQQKAGAFDYASLGTCGVNDGYLYDPTFANTTVTFACNAGLLGGDTAVKPTRSELQIDGANAYAPAAAFAVNSAAAGLPAVTTSYTLDAATGDVAIHETDPLVTCPSTAYPPTAASCSKFTASGVTDNRTISQDHDGRISWISDVFTSTDGKAHALDLLWDNSQRFWGPSGNSTQLEYELPGQTAFAKHAVGDAVALHGAPGRILVRMSGAADGEVSTGQGAIVFDRPASQARFTYAQPTRSTFTLHQTGTVPAGASTRFRFAYVQDYHAATVASLAQTARAAFLNTVAVARSGKGRGKVTSAPGGISCGKTCSHGYGYGTSLTLKAKPAKGSRFVRWSGACKGAGRCRLVVGDPIKVGATFALRPCVVPNVLGKPLRAAKLAIKRRFCSVGKVTIAPSTLVRGRVVSQRPKPGQKLKQHARVDLVVSGG